MIGRLAGVVLFTGQDHVILDVRGVGYVVHVSARTLAALPPVGQAAALWTDLLVREDLLQLFGFLTLAEKEWHRLLISVQGVGAKASMSILGTLGPAAAGRAIALGDWAAIKAAPGIGPKLAQRVVMELKEKAPAVMAMGAMGGAMGEGGAFDAAGAFEAFERDAAATLPTGTATPATPPPAAATADALSALINLGYGQGEAAAAVATAAGADPGAASPALIRAALKALAPKP
ncbi:MAG: Holliday junction branch migration protein RuvA [Paracoccaceae bacterium]